MANFTWSMKLKLDMKNMSKQALDRTNTEIKTFFLHDINSCRRELKTYDYIVIQGIWYELLVNCKLAYASDKSRVSFYDVYWGENILELLNVGFDKIITD